MVYVKSFVDEKTTRPDGGFHRREQSAVQITKAGQHVCLVQRQLCSVQIKRYRLDCGVLLGRELLCTTKAFATAVKSHHLISTLREVNCGMTGAARYVECDATCDEQIGMAQ